MLSWLQQLLLTLLACVVANSHVAVAQPDSTFPSLFVPLPGGDPESFSTASALMLQLPGDVKVVRAASGTGGKTPNVMLTRINHEVLAADPTGLSLVLPGVAAPVQVNQVPTMQASANMANVNANDNVWFGEVAGKPGGMSVVTMLTQDYRVYGNVRYYDQTRKAFRTFKIMPKPGTNTTTARLMAEYQARQSTLNATVGPDGNISYPYPYATPPANTTDFTAWANTTYTAQALNPQQQKQDYIVVEYKEPTGKRTFLTPPAAKPTALQASSTLEGVAVSSTPASTAVAADAADTNAAAAANSGAGRRKLQQSTVVQDLLIVYTAAAANKAGGEEALKAAARNTVAMTNKAYTDSGINLRLSLVDIRLVSYNEFSRSKSDDVLKDLTDGRIPNVMGWRDQLGADLVSLFHNLPDVCGIGWVGGGANYGYSTVNNGCWNGYTLGHEIGHNQGCGHNYEDNDGRGYRYGWRWCGRSSFKTIMSYRCPNGAASNEIGYFATPNLNIPNVGPIGDATRGHCARAIGESATSVAGYRPSATNTISGTIAIRGGRLGKYCSDDQDRVICNRDSAQAWERFRVENVGPNKVALRGGRQGYYCSDDGDRMICNRNYASPGAWEVFTVESLGNNRIALRGGRQNLYCADDADRMICNRAAVGAWETLTVERL